MEVEAEPAPPSTGTLTPEPPDASSEEAPLQGLVAPAIARDLNEMFFAAGALERRLILLNLELVAPTTKRVEIVREPLLAQRLEMAALTRNREEFALAIANALHISRAQARRVLSDGLGEPIVAATKALAIPREVVYRILLFVNSAIGHSVERVHALANLYDELSVKTQSTSSVSGRCSAPRSAPATPTARCSTTTSACARVQARRQRGGRPQRPRARRSAAMLLDSGT